MCDQKESEFQLLANYLPRGVFGGLNIPLSFLLSHVPMMRDVCLCVLSGLSRCVGVRTVLFCIAVTINWTLLNRVPKFFATVLEIIFCESSRTCQKPLTLTKVDTIQTRCIKLQATRLNLTTTQSNCCVDHVTIERMMLLLSLETELFFRHSIKLNDQYVN